MKRLIFAALAPLIAAPAQAETLWVGNAFVTAAVQPTCADPASVGDYSRGIFRPAGVSLGNGANSYFAYIGTRSNLAFYVPNNAFQSEVNYGAYFVNSYVSFGGNVAGITAWTLTPPVISSTQKNYTLNATFANFFDLVGCTVSLEADLELLP